MLRRGIFSLLFLLSFIQLHAQELKNNASVRSSLFLKGDSAYIETAFVVAANAIRFAEIKPGKFQGSLEVQVIISNGYSVVNFDKYTLNSPVITDTNGISFSIIDQKRLQVPNQSLTVETTLADVYDKGNNYVKSESILPLLTDQVQISDIQFIESYEASSTPGNFTKNGFDMKPYPLDFFPATQSSFIFYGEVYFSDKYINGPFMIASSIRQAGTDEVNNKFYRYSKSTSAGVVPFLLEFDISDLPGGNYNLFVEVRDVKNNLITQRRIFFQRANNGPITAWENIQLINTTGTFVDSYTEEQLNYYLDILYPIASLSDARLIESLSDRVEPDMKRKFLYNFWVERNPEDPEKAWLAYLEQVKIVNQNFGSPSRPGYKTDRGRVYLQYGAPYDIVRSVNEPGAYPYEIWFYTTLPDKQTNIGFAFYEPSLSSNDYTLLHSNARNELHDPRWKIKLYENVASQDELNDFDNTDVQDKVHMQRAVDMYDF